MIQESLENGLVLGDTAMPQVESVKDFGVIIDNRLKFDIHMSHIVSHAHRIANLIHKCFVSKPTLYCYRCSVVCLCVSVCMCWTHW